MLQQIYAIYDKPVNRFGPPMMFSHDEEAKRHVRNAVLKEGNDLNRYPEEYSLCRLGHYEDTDGRLVSLSMPETICALHELKTINLQKGA